MWYFTWVLGIGFAVLLAILNAMWGENEAAREAARTAGSNPAGTDDDQPPR
ncbi:cytochrome bd-I oxidase subunit CydX [Azoarcus sp. L1K30]|uniref:cytochrome bd-I oxidase subunit CydX n=1 Tax=Azoarcus sp. L1K30 TaxID=2820277 RepID=UPI001B832A47|nr:cytochrome bd-I oxidase subunit CydX [Azoarcus sp. L1K30]MBR0564770.1 cytochrome bd-I oxidase subunit CydX [Azoarcus sp. L1K30]